MWRLTAKHEGAPGRTGDSEPLHGIQTMKIAVIDSGVAIPHPHIGPIAGGVSINDDGESEDFRDLLGHGTAVMAAIMLNVGERAPAAEYFAVRVFQTTLRTRVENLVHAIEWSLEHQADLINLSLGTQNPSHDEKFAPLIERARAANAFIISAATALPGSLDGVVSVSSDPECPRDQYRVHRTGARTEFRASPYARPIPGVPLERNLNGISFAVANMTGIIARDYDRIRAELEIGTNSNPRS